mmetsp:Transcript_8226/g.12245  ORF Transcript_8226/g.12245 Transcript_8226/m.12245 type:complete len:101 (-) Transcript_8226:110-412(-)
MSRGPVRRGRSHGMSSELDDMVSPHGPAELKVGFAVDAEVDLLSIGQDQAFSAGNRPDECDLMFFAAAVNACKTLFQCFCVAETEFPSNSSFTGSNQLSA